MLRKTKTENLNKGTLSSGYQVKTPRKIGYENILLREAYIRNKKREKLLLEKCSEMKDKLEEKGKPLPPIVDDRIANLEKMYRKVIDDQKKYIEKLENRIGKEDLPKKKTVEPQVPKKLSKWDRLTRGKSTSELKKRRAERMKVKR
jgi:hypothetical protein